MRLKRIFEKFLAKKERNPMLALPKVLFCQDVLHQDVLKFQDIFKHCRPDCPDLKRPPKNLASAAEIP